MEEQMNYIGATVFWLYIVAALFFTSVVIRKLITIPQARGTEHAQRQQGVVVFAVLAGVSFATLSVNMMNVLIQSFQAWSQRNNIDPFDSILENVWRWSITSTLFQDFGEAIVKDTARYLWSEAALLATFSTCLYMGAEGRRREVPGLWAFFCLSQTLPISLTQNLFYVALLRLPDSKSRSVAPHAMLLGLSGAYCGILVFLVIAPNTARSFGVIPVILITRLLLFAPIILFRLRDTGGPYDRGTGPGLMDGHQAQSLFASLASVCLIGQVLITTRERSLWDVANALFSHPAVSSLGCDLIISILSFVVWISIHQDVAKTTTKSGKAA